jgi:hypothetical protein
MKAVFSRTLSADEAVSEAGKEQDLSSAKQMLFDRFYLGNPQI